MAKDTMAKDTMAQEELERVRQKELEEFKQEELERVLTVIDRLSVALRNNATCTAQEYWDSFVGQFDTDDGMEFADEFSKDVLAFDHALAHARSCMLRTAAKYGVRIRPEVWEPLEPAGR